MKRQLFFGGGGGILIHKKASILWMSSNSCLITHIMHECSLKDYGGNYLGATFELMVTINAKVLRGNARVAYK